MKKLLAILMAVALCFSLVACGGNEDEETTAPETTVANVVEPVENETTVADVEETTLADSEETTVADSEETTVADSEETTVAADGLNSTDIAEVVAFYNAAVVKTDKAGSTPGQSKMVLSGAITGDGAIGAILKVLSPAAESALAKNSTPTDDIPGRGTLKASDCSAASATTKNGVTTISITLKTQVDGSDADGVNGGPVARGIGTLGSIDSALKELGAELKSGRDTVKLTYNKATIKCTVNNDGKITSGTWKYTVNIFVGDAKASISVLSANLKNLKAAVDFQVVI